MSSLNLLLFIRKKGATLQDVRFYLGFLFSCIHLNGEGFEGINFANNKAGDMIWLLMMIRQN